MHVKNRAPKAGTLASGVHGQIRWHYLPAAEVHAFTVDRDESGALTLQCHVSHADDYKLAQSPLTFVVTLRRGAWHWPITQVLGYRDHAFAARLGDPVAKGGTP